MFKLTLIVLTITITSCYASAINNNWENDNTMIDDYFPGNDTIMSRTFGGIRRLKIAIPAIMYKLGVVTTMLGFLTLLTIKGVLIGLIILILQLSAGLSKLHHHSEKKEQWEPEWPHKPPQNIHVHVHGNGHHGSGGHYSYSPASLAHSSVWDRDRSDTKSNLNLYASLTPYSAYSNYNKNSNNLANSRLDDDLLIKLREYKELKELRDLRDSLYQQVV